MTSAEGELEGLASCYRFAVCTIWRNSGRVCLKNRAPAANFLGPRKMRLDARTTSEATTWDLLRPAARMPVRPYVVTAGPVTARIRKSQID